MTSQIRKQQGKGSQDDTNRQAGEVRRSRRDRVPSNKYAQSIEELRRVIENDIQTVVSRDVRNRAEKNLNSEESSWSHKKFEEQDDQRSDPSEWMKCLLPEGNSKARLIDVEVVCNRPVQRSNGYIYLEVSQYSEIRNERRTNRKTQDDQQVHDQPRKIVKKTFDNPAKSNLLEILMQAAKKVAQQPEHRVRQNARNERVNAEYNEEESNMQVEDEQQTEQQVDDSDGRIIRVAQYSDKLVFEHSRNGEIQIPMTWTTDTGPDQPKVEPVESKINVANLHKCITEYRRKVHNPMILT